MHDATTDWGKSHVGEVLRDPETWRGAVYIKSSHAELQLNKEEYDFVSNSMADFQPSKEVSNMMKSVPLASKSDDEMISMHIRAGEDAELSKDLSLAGEGAAEIQLIDSYRRKCSVDSFVNTLVRRAPDAVQRGIDIFVAADEPSDVDVLAEASQQQDLRARPPGLLQPRLQQGEGDGVHDLRRADLFLLSRNPGPMLRSKFSSFSDFANYYRKRSGRLQGKGFLVNGCEDDGGSDGVLTASLGRDEDTRASSDATISTHAASTSVSTPRMAKKEAPVAKTSTGGRVVARFAMGVEGAGFGRTDSKLPAGLSDFAADADCAHAWFAQCGEGGDPHRAPQARRLRRSHRHRRPRRQQLDRRRRHLRDQVPLRRGTGLQGFSRRVVPSNGDRRGMRGIHRGFLPRPRGCLRGPGQGTRPRLT